MARAVNDARVTVYYINSNDLSGTLFPWYYINLISYNIYGIREVIKLTIINSGILLNHLLVQTNIHEGSTNHFTSPLRNHLFQVHRSLMIFYISHYHTLYANINELCII